MQLCPEVVFSRVPNQPLNAASILGLLLALTYWVLRCYWNEGE